MSMFRSITINPANKGLTVIETTDVEEMRDKGIKEMRNAFKTSAHILPMSRQIILRQGKGAFELGERVVHIGTLEPAAMLQLCQVAVIGQNDGNPEITLDTIEDLYPNPLPACASCFCPFQSTEVQHEAKGLDGEAVLYCDTCKAMLLDIAKKVAVD